MKVPFEVSGCLYSGIYNTIDYLNRMYEHESDERIREMYNRIEVSLEWYEEHCLVSANHLREGFNQLHRTLYNHNSDLVESLES